MQDPGCDGAMKTFLFFFFIASVCWGQKRLLVLGDSLTEGIGVARDLAYPALLEKKLHQIGKKDWVVINAGLSGATTASALSRLKWQFKNRPDLVLLVLGGNDGLRALKIEDSQKNLDQAIQYIREQKVPVILGGLYMPPNYGKEYTEKFKQMYSALAKKHQLAWVPFILDSVAGDSKYNLPDGIHPNEKGHAIIAENIFKVLKGAL
jgi:acyl-CoA thioesterase-1